MSTEWGGWANRETHMFQANWENNEGAYNFLKDRAYDAVVENTEISDEELGSVLVRAFQAFLRNHTDQRWAGFVNSDIGDWDRVNRAEVGAAVREDLVDMFRGTTK